MSILDEITPTNVKLNAPLSQALNSKIAEIHLEQAHSAELEEARLNDARAIARQNMRDQLNHLIDANWALDVTDPHKPVAYTDVRLNVNGEIYRITLEKLPPVPEVIKPFKGPTRLRLSVYANVGTPQLSKLGSTVDLEVGCTLDQLQDEIAKILAA